MSAHIARLHGCTVLVCLVLFGHALHDDTYACTYARKVYAFKGYATRQCTHKSIHKRLPIILVYIRTGSHRYTLAHV